MSKEKLEQLRYWSHKLIRELEVLEINYQNPQENPQNWHILIEISQNPQITISEIAQKLLINVSTVSRNVDDLINDKFVKEELSPEDARQKLLSITKKGECEVVKINEFSRTKILSAFRFLGQKDQEKITAAIKKYSSALEKSRLFNEAPKFRILTLSKSKDLRLRVKNMIENIQKNEFGIKVTDETNDCVIHAEDEFYYHGSNNFFYAIDEKGRAIGCIGLKKIDNKNAELKKFFVTKEFRRQKVGSALFEKLIEAAQKHNFRNIYLGSVDILDVAHDFYKKRGFKRVAKTELPKKFSANSLDNVFFSAKLRDIA